ncbi:MAG: N-acetyl-D-Glu racemase DgcA [Pseudorhodoplanes sp.]|uniref:N-acetyl-D-Glu racemase DgcA n=1 Tax=Pseudorhodoplanes sp. TaxID=1934341 RepID=UPI003D0974FA
MVNPNALRLTVTAETWPIAGQFTISRGAKTEAIVVVAELSDGRFRGRGECVPYSRYGESPAAVAAVLRQFASPVADGLTRIELQRAMPAGAARNALDCAFWDLEAKRTGQPVYSLARLPPPRPLITAYTISLGTPEAMARAAHDAAGRQLLKIKLGAEGDPARLAAIRAAAPEAELIVDANEGWNPDNLAGNLASCAQAGVTLIEQPLPADADEALRAVARPVPVCADESAHDRASLSALSGKYDAVNIKLDKTGGLTEALAMAEEARQRGLSTMAGCMVATSLSMAPAMLVAQTARVADLDGPLLLARDRAEGLVYEGSLVYPPLPALWG